MDSSSPQLQARSEKRNSTVDEKRDPELEPGSIEHKPDLDKQHVIAHDDDDEAERKREQRNASYHKYRPFILAAVALVILGWWISATVLKATRHRWIVQTFWAWFFILIIAFRFIPNSVVTRPVSAVWQPIISRPFFSLSYHVRLGMGWLALLGIVFGSAFGFPLPQGTGYGDRAISVFGLFVFTTGFWLSSKHRSQVPWPTVIVGLFMQQAIALFVLKTDAGFKIFLWIARLAADFLHQANPAAGFFFGGGNTNWFLQFAWFFFKTLNVSGAEAVVAAASPWIGQGESVCLVRPFVGLMTESEIYLTMTSGFSTIAGSVFAAYVNMGVPGQNLVTSSVMSIPASIAISKLRIPETDEPLTRGQVIIDQGAEDKHGRPANVLHAFSKGAIFGLIVAGHILCNVLTVLALVYTIDGLLTWVGKGFGIHELTLDLIFGYLFYPVTFLLGVPRGELLRVARLLATKLVANEFVAYQALKDQHAANPFSRRAYTIASYGLCGFANLGEFEFELRVLH
ncbi:Solute carrier family 28 member 3 [Rhizoctonia solani]|uniref:Solute carrier family 28 member 3 n=1 Tax=Rhizoctonia solani TaxID=456999 RepID=A0A0K6G7I3_9AGAM|nr:Solute carrier family 28 member 3 [Rhizoctonia solani]